MTSDAQRQLLDVLAEVWQLAPDVRLGQLLAHLDFLGEAHVNRGLGDVEDDELLAILYRHRAELVARSPSTSPVSQSLPSDALSVSGSPTASLPAPRSRPRRLAP